MTRLARIGVVVCTFALLYVGAGAAHGLAHPPVTIARCPRFEDCWALETWCDHYASRRELYACRAWVRTQCMARAERCRGGWSL